MTCHLVNNSSLINNEKRTVLESIADQLQPRYVAKAMISFYFQNSNYYLLEMRISESSIA